MEGSAVGDRKELLHLLRVNGVRRWADRNGCYTDKDIGDWHGVTTNDEGRVIKLVLLMNGIRGTIPKGLANLSHLQTLKLHVNKLSGLIPKELGKLSAVKEIVLIRNELTGPIPKELGNLPALEKLLLYGNRLTGPIPKELAGLPVIKELKLDYNLLTEVPLDLLLAFRQRDGSKRIFSVQGNPLLQPPQTVMDVGIDQAIAWWENIARFGAGTSNKLKMVLVGLAEAGKSTVVRNITGTPIPEVLDRTVGIEITESWKPVVGGPLEISIWDFAGQADYYASHQIFLTRGSLFLLVVDLQALFKETGSGGDNGGDPHGRVYRWLEILHLRVPGAAVALIGTHTDAAEFRNPAELDKAVAGLEHLVTRYVNDKAKEAEQTEARTLQEAPQPLFIHDRVFRTSLEPDSTAELVGWVVRAATLADCPAGFNFPAVGATIPKVWIDANTAMHELSAGQCQKRYVTWREAVDTFNVFMEGRITAIPDAEKILLQAMRHREAEGGVLLWLEHDPPRLGESTGMLYLDPTWLIEVIRRLTDHNLVDIAQEGNIKVELREYREKHALSVKFDTLWAQYRSFRSSGTLGREYLRFLWLHRHVDNGFTLDLDDDEFNGVLETMVKLLVMYRAPTSKATDCEVYVVPARFPELGDEHVLENGNMGLGDAVVRVECSFGQAYSPPGIIGRFLAFSNAHIKEARECWQHGAHLKWGPDFDDVLVYERHLVETSDIGSVTYPGLVLCVKGSGNNALRVIHRLMEQVKNLFEDKVHGYPGLCSESFGDTQDVLVRDLLSDLREYLGKQVDRLETLVERVETLVEGVARVTTEVLQAFYLAAEDKNKYPRLLVLKQERDPETDTKVKIPETSTSSPGFESDRAEAAKWMQPAVWNDLIHDLMEGQQYRLVFICEHDRTEVRCGPDGEGYPVKDPPKWMKGGMVLLQVSFYALRVAVGMISHVDLPLNDLLAALANSASTELLGVMPTSISAPSLTEASTLRNPSTESKEQQQLKRMQEESYSGLCTFMQKLESPSSTCCGLRSECSSCRSTPHDDCVCVRWEDEMVRVRNGKGGLVWVKRTNAAAYRQQVNEEADMCKTSPHA